MKLLRWLRSRPLARVRRNLATEKRIRAKLGPQSEEMRAWLYKPWIGGKGGWILPAPLPPELQEDAALLTFEEWLDTSPLKRLQ